MGMRGPQPQPAAVAALKNSSRRSLNLSDGINPPVEVPDPPKWLNKWSLQEWRRASTELSELGLIAKIDLTSFAVYCQTWGELCELETEFAAKKDAARKTAGRDQKHAAAVELYFFHTPSGLKRQSPLHRQIEEMRKAVDVYARNFGMNASARMRVQPSNMIQPDLFSNEAPSSGQVVPITGFAKFAQAR